MEVRAATGPSALRLPARPDSTLTFAELPLLLLPLAAAAEGSEEASEGGAGFAGASGACGLPHCGRTLGCSKRPGGQATRGGGWPGCAALLVRDS